MERGLGEIWAVDLTESWLLLSSVMGDSLSLRLVPPSSSLSSSSSSWPGRDRSWGSSLLLSGDSSREKGLTINPPLLSLLSSWPTFGELSRDLACLSRAAREEEKLLKWCGKELRLLEEATEDGREADLSVSTSACSALGEVISGN